MTTTSKAAAEQPAIAGVLGVRYLDPISDELGWRKERVATPPAPPKPEMFNGPLGEATKALTQHVSFCPISFYVQALACAATVLGPGPHQREGAALRATSQYMVVVGGTGSGKGRASTYARSVGTRIAADFERSMVIDGVQSGEALVTALADEVVSDGGETDAHPASDTRTLMLAEEWAQLLGTIEARGKTTEAVFTKAWDGRPVSLRTRGLTVTANRPDALSVVGHVTAEELKRVVTADQVFNGFLNRWSFFIGHQVQHTDEDAWPDDVPGFWEAVDKAAVNIHEARRRDGLFTRTAAADDVLRETRDAFFYRDVPEHIEVLTTRWRAHMIKAATLFAVLDGSPNTVEAEHMIAARALYAYSERCIRALFTQGFSKDPYAERFMTAWSATGYADLSLKEALTLLSNNWSAAKRDGVLDSLQKAGVLTLMPDPNAKPGKRVATLITRSDPSQTSSTNNLTDW